MVSGRKKTVRWLLLTCMTGQIVLVPGLVSPIESLGVFVDEINEGLKVAKGGWLEAARMPPGEGGNQDRNERQPEGEPYYLGFQGVSTFRFNGK
jgi:hypothetical protein